MGVLEVSEVLEAFAVELAADMVTSVASVALVALVASETEVLLADPKMHPSRL